MADQVDPLAKFHVGDKVWLNQGAIPACEIVELNTNGQACLKIRGWVGERHWYPVSKLYFEHPITGKKVV